MNNQEKYSQTRDTLNGHIDAEIRTLLSYAEVLNPNSNKEFAEIIRIVEENKNQGTVRPGEIEVINRIIRVLHEVAVALDETNKIRKNTVNLFPEKYNLFRYLTARILLRLRSNIRYKTELRILESSELIAGLISDKILHDNHQNKVTI